MLFCAAQASFENFADLDCLALADKALEILDVMEDGVVARKIADYIRPIINRLRERRSIPANQLIGIKAETPQDMPFFGVPGFDASWNSNTAEMDFFRTGMNGMNFLEGGLWDLDVGFAEAYQNDNNMPVMPPNSYPLP